MLGIGTRLRGAEDATSPMISSSERGLRAGLGADSTAGTPRASPSTRPRPLAQVDPARHDTSPAGALQ